MSRPVKCLFCDRSFTDKHKFCDHIVYKHNEQIPQDVEDGYEYAYSLFVNKPMGRLCLMCRKRKVAFNDDTLKYARLCDDPKCKEDYVKLMKSRMVNVYGKEHLLNDGPQQRKMMLNHADARDYVWDDKHKFRVIGNYEVDFLNHLKSMDWSPDDIIAPSPVDFHYKWGDGTQHLYIPDFFIPSLNLHVEIKQGNFNTSFMEHNRDIEARKDQMMRNKCKRTGMHYIKILDKNYDEFDDQYVDSPNNRPEQG